MLNKAACWSSWYGEVYDPTPTDWTWTDMGSGEFDTAGYGYAAYVRDPMWRDVLFAPQFPMEGWSMEPRNQKCYWRSWLTTSLSPWNRFFYLGGPGGDAAGCD